MSGAPASADPFTELKARQAVVWGAAPFERITETFAEIHDRLSARLAPRHLLIFGQRREL